VDADDRLVGIVTHDDAMDVVQEEATEDAYLQSAVAPLDDTYEDTPTPHDSLEARDLAVVSVDRGVDERARDRSLSLIHQRDRSAIVSDRRPAWRR
jgi:hypothetical protein